MLCLISISSISAADNSSADTVSILGDVDAADGSLIGDAAYSLDDVSSADESPAIADSESQVVQLMHFQLLQSIKKLQNLLQRVIHTNMSERL